MQTNNYNRNRYRLGIWFTAPAVIVLLTVLAYPIVASLVLSFLRVRFGGDGLSFEFNGIANYADLVTKPIFREALFRSIYFTVVEVAAVIFFALIVALMLNHPLGRPAFYRIVLLVPWALSPVANAVLWKWIYNANISRLWLVVHAFERDALRLRVGSTARVAFAALPGQPASGNVTQLGRRVDPSSRTVDVRIELENPDQLLRPGMSATALVPVGESGESVVAVPVEALQRRPEGWCVFLPGAEEGVFEIRPVARGRELGGAVEVLSGLRAGERVVVDGAFLLRAEAERARGGAGEHHH